MDALIPVQSEERDMWGFLQSEEWQSFTEAFPKSSSRAVLRATTLLVSSAHWPTWFEDAITTQKIPLGVKFAAVLDTFAVRNEKDEEQ